ncbi:dTDP-4-dehydrorhamnose reductase [Geothrix sp. 21YS21S-2]|uniref:dTDP-4-dehydrorhamnose reductase n=1 Tax=Geothrix sp. 21YS21S-2 TaxID=3068893 RepID=UPI0027B96802|nr:dTDP-4-dehydrorhamnose reductase [Geothrix sp. 21YS21S-2]
MNILVTGAAGQLAYAIQKTWSGHDLILPEESSLDLCSEASVLKALRGFRPDVVVNCAAFTQVDRCETEPGLARLVNGEAVGWLARGCGEVNALLVQISTDYVFDGTGDRPYREDDPTGPRSEYGKSKLLGEQKAALAPRHLILRTAWLYDAWGKNFLRTMLACAAQGRSLRVVDDQFGSPTSCRALARQMRVAVEEGWEGLVHATCTGKTSWHGFAAEIFRQSGLQVDLKPCGTRDYPLPAPRPAYSVLDGTRRGTLGTDLMPAWADALGEVIQFPEI